MRILVIVVISTWCIVVMGLSVAGVVYSVRSIDGHFDDLRQKIDNRFNEIQFRVECS
jgi:hypothetical protein